MRIILNAILRKNWVLIENAMGMQGTALSLQDPGR
jgi:hypothetical protein